MFDQIELPIEISKYLISISPLLGISQTIENPKLYVISRYLALNNNKILILFSSNDMPSEISLNLLRKGEDRILISAYLSNTIEKKFLCSGKRISTPSYIHSIISFELKLIERKELDSNNFIGIYEPLFASGVAGLDASFNDDTTIAKTIEVMSLTAVDKYVIEKKLKN